MLSNLYLISTAYTEHCRGADCCALTYAKMSPKKTLPQGIGSKPMLQL